MLRSRDSLLDARRNESRPVLSAPDGGGAVVAGAAGSTAGTASSVASAWPPAHWAIASRISAGIAAAMTSTTIGPFPRRRLREWLVLIWRGAPSDGRIGRGVRA